MLELISIYTKALLDAPTKQMNRSQLILQRLTVTLFKQKCIHIIVRFGRVPSTTAVIREMCCPQLTESCEGDCDLFSFGEVITKLACRDENPINSQLNDLYELRLLTHQNMFQSHC